MDAGAAPQPDQLDLLNRPASSTGAFVESACSGIGAGTGTSTAMPAEVVASSAPSAEGEESWMSPGRGRSCRATSQLDVVKGTRVEGLNKD
jgi:hypothetical protein